ncbi:hypothetical protein GF312_19430 [Candidatus Poribacteria bacterium]|nr:hypothetical protein [Candidatus Poribacteria bacterium]
MKNFREEEPKPSESITEFRKRMERIEDRLNQADRLFDNMQENRSKSDKAADAVIETLEVLETGIKRFINSVFSPTSAKDTSQHKHSLSYTQIRKGLSLCSVEELKVIRDEIDKILQDRKT